MRYVTELTHESSVQHFETQSVSVLLGKMWPTDNPLDPPQRIVGGKMLPAVLEAGWDHYPVPKELGMSWPQLDEGYEVVEQPAKLADTHNRMQVLKEARDAFEFCGDGVAGDLGKLAPVAKKLKDKPDDPAAGKEWTDGVAKLTHKHSPMLGVLNPLEEPKVAVKDKADLFDLLAGMTPKTTRGELVLATEAQQAALEKILDAAGNRLGGGFEPYMEALTGVGLFALNGGTQGPTYVINCQDPNLVLSRHRAQLIKLLRGIRGACHIDLAFLNPVTGGTGPLQKLGSEMDKHVRGGIWATPGGIINEAYAIKFGENNRIVATEGAGSVFAYIGMIPHRGYLGVSAAAQLGKQVTLDRRFTDHEAGPMTHNFGPQSFKNIDGVDGDLAATAWDTDTLRTLAREGGLNVLIRHDNGVVSPYLARTQSSLPNYRFINGSRMANILVGAVMQYMNVAAPAAGNTPAVRRAFCEAAEELFFGRFRSRDGFKGSIVPMESSGGTRFELGFSIRTPDPIEEIAVIRRNREIVVK